MCFVDTQVDALDIVRKQGFTVVRGSGLSSDVLASTGIESKLGLLAVTANDEVNWIVARKAREEFRLAKTWIALRRGRSSVGPADVEKHGIEILFGNTRYLEFWNVEFERHRARIEWWAPSQTLHLEDMAEGSIDVFLPFAYVVDKAIHPFASPFPKRVDKIAVGIAKDKEEQAYKWMKEHGWVSAQTPGDSVMPMKYATECD